MTEKTRQGGFTLLEVMLALAVLSVGTLALAQAVLSTSMVLQANYEDTVAINMARERMADMENSARSDFSTVFATYTTVSNATIVRTDPSDKGRDISIAITFPSQGTQLRENIANVQLGMPSDLNGDGVIDGNDHSTNYTILPVLVTASWTSTIGRMESGVPRRSVTLYSLLGPTKALSQ